MNLKEKLQQLKIKLEEVSRMRDLAQKDWGGATLAENPREIPVQDRLKERIMGAERELADLRAALDSLEKQPGLLETLNLLRKVGI